MDISDVFHRCNLSLSYVGWFIYVVPPLPEDTSILLCINLLLFVGWLNSTDFFCDAAKIVVDNANVYALDPNSTFVVYPHRDGVYKTSNSAKASPKCLQYTDIYMENLICAAQGYPTPKQSVSNLTICAFKEIFPSFPDEVLDPQLQ